MFILCHVFAGMVLGISLAPALRMRTAVGIAVLGSILPDLVDKPLALFLFPGQSSVGQTFVHMLCAILIVLAATLLVYHWYPDRLLFLFPAAVLLHQVMDLSWVDPVTWLYPVLGPLQDCHCGGAGYVSLQSHAELLSLSEWIFLAVSLLLVALLFRERITGWTGRDPATAARLLFPAAIVLLVLMGLTAVIAGLLGLPTPLLAGEINPSGDLMLAAVSLAGAVILHARRDRILNPV
ncbi:MAG: metal-dependent hydrolase [Methanomicrobiales archaeon]|nr:metal-dependent hydrolase [Methanomicrobiales archaeon]